LRKKINDKNDYNNNKANRNQSSDAAYIQNNLNINLLAFENKTKNENNYHNNNIENNNISGNCQEYIKTSPNYIKTQTLDDHTNTSITNISFGYNPLSTDFVPERQQDKDSYKYSKEGKIL